MRIFILDKESREIERLLSWLPQGRHISAAEVFRNQDEMIRRMTEAPPELCFIRLGSADIQGLKVAEEVKRTRLATRIVFISYNRDYAIDAYELGAYGYLVSPVAKEKFEKCIREALGLPLP